MYGQRQRKQSWKVKTLFLLYFPICLDPPDTVSLSPPLYNIPTLFSISYQEKENIYYLMLHEILMLYFLCIHSNLSGRTKEFDLHSVYLCLTLYVPYVGSSGRNTGWDIFIEVFRIQNLEEWISSRLKSQTMMYVLRWLQYLDGKS